VQRHREESIAALEIADVLSACGFHWWLVKLLLDHGASRCVDVPGPRGRTPLHSALRAMDPAAAELLMRAGADPLRRDADGRSALHLAAARGAEAPLRAVLRAVGRRGRSAEAISASLDTPSGPRTPRDLATTRVAAALLAAAEREKTVDGSQKMGGPAPVGSPREESTREEATREEATRRGCAKTATDREETGSRPSGLGVGAESPPPRSDAARESLRRCGIDRREASELGAEGFWRGYVVPQRPVLLRGALASDAPAQTRWRCPKDLAQAHGSLRVTVGRIPYAAQVGAAERTTTLRAFLDGFGRGSWGEIDAVEPASETPEYVFDLTPCAKRTVRRQRPEGPRRPEDARNRTLASTRRERTETASLIAMHDPVASQARDGGAQWVADLGALDVLHAPFLVPRHCQLYLGAARSGAPAHFHGHALNVLVHGEKLWTLTPPALATVSSSPVGSRAVASSEPEEPEKGSVFACVQQPGDAVYVPSGWGHRVVNLRASVGAAIAWEEGGHVDADDLRVPYHRFF
jgi:hypothetical protein